MRRLVVPVVVIAMFAGAWGIWVLLRGGGSNIEPARAGVVALDRPVPFIAGREIYGGGRFAPPVFHRRILVVNFWNPYCSPCRAEATVLDLSLGATRLMHAPVTFAGVLYSNANFPHDVAAARRFARLYGERYPTIDDPGGVIARRFGIRGIPTTMIADEKGRLRYEILGKVKPGQIERLVRRVLRR